ncbi:hypothetical protein D1AOALGA4SA_5804 [Olavius algarvensis Delta 1 endosymbiont]|nr:hypothetical protein D1AOALGA4SA_5804 [Olavius algarvensis Delta 1 endosymbiont]
MEVLILTTSHFKSSGHNHLQDIRPYFKKTERSDSTLRHSAVRNSLFCGSLLM